MNPETKPVVQSKINYVALALMIFGAPQAQELAHIIAQVIPESLRPYAVSAAGLVIFVLRTFFSGSQIKGVV